MGSNAFEDFGGAGDDGRQEEEFFLDVRGEVKQPHYL